MNKAVAAQARKPTFVGIGAQKCASSWLHVMLGRHPQVTVPEIKEVDFFSYRFDHGYEWYLRHFAFSEETEAGGEISPSYFCDQAAPKRVAEFAPDAKILVALRDPVERVLSNHRHEVRVGHLNAARASLDAGLLNNPMYVEQSLYATNIKRWLKHFPLERVKVVLQEDIEANPLAVLADVYAFVGVDATFKPNELTKRANPSYANRFSRLTRVKDLIYGLSRGPVGSRLWSAASKVGLRSAYRNLNIKPSSTVIAPPSEETIQELRRRFEPEVMELAEILGRPLDMWR